MAKVQKRRIDEIGEESRHRIMDAAENLFAERGYGQTSLIDIAERSGISRGSIPWHFQNKEGLLTAVVERAVTRHFSGGTFSSFDAKGFRASLERVKGWLRQPISAIFFMVLVEALSNKGSVHKQYAELLRRRREGIRIMLAAGTDFRVPSDIDADALATAFAGSMIGLHLQAEIDPTIDIDAAVDALATVLERALEMR